MAKTKNLPVINGLEIRDSYIDPDTQKVVTVNQEQAYELASIEMQIAASVTNLMLSLKRVRDTKLYLLRCDTFDDYLSSIGIARHTAYRQLKIADTFGASKHFEDLVKLPQTMLLDASKNDDLAAQLCEGEVTTASGEVLTIEEIINSGTVQLRAEIEKSQKQYRNYKSKYEATDENRKLIESELSEWKDKVGSENFVRITKKKEAMSTLFAVEGEINSVITSLDSIDNTDVEVMGKIGALLGQIKYAVDALEDKLAPHLVKTGERA